MNLGAALCPARGALGLVGKATLRTIPFFRATTPLTPAERLAKRRLVIQDTLALVSIFAVTCVLGVLTYLIFRSYSQHQSDAAVRWRRRGYSDLAAGNAGKAVFDLRAALGFAPDDRPTQIALAGALAQAGLLREANVYFNTLWEKEPGNGDINLQLARLAARQDQVSTALTHYHAAIYGVWEGDGTVRRRQVRLELVRYLIQQSRFNDARDELLIAAGNDNTTPALLEVAGLLEQAHAPADALHLYHQVAERRPVDLVALEGAGEMAFTLGRYRLARTYLDKAVTASSAAHPLVDRARTEKNLQIANAVLAAYPSPELTQRERLRRVVRAHEIARQRFMSCSAALNAQSDGTSEASGGGKDQSKEGTTNGDAMASLSSRWQAARPHLTIADMQDNAQLEQAAMQLVYDTEQITEHVCGEPKGEDAALLRIAASPDAIDRTD